MQTPPQKKKSKLQSERERRGWSRKYVAQQIGVSEYTAGQWERGRHMPYPEHIQRLCDLFETNAETLGLVDSTAASSGDERERFSTTIATGQKRKRHLLYAISKDVYACDANLRLLGAPPGQIIISFDVYDRQGNVNLAPNGQHRLIYLPGH